MGYKALSALRLEMGVPWFGYDFGEKQIPHEAGLQDSHISYTKGCYTGQEIVERVRSRGHANRVRVGLKFSSTESSAELEAEAMPLFADGKEIGFVTRTAYSPLIEAPIGMGYVRRENSAPGTVLDRAAGKAEVVPLPPLPVSRG
jgi:aminomethyltransferase